MDERGNTHEIDFNVQTANNSLNSLKETAIGNLKRINFITVEDWKSTPNTIRGKVDPAVIYVD